MTTAQRTIGVAQDQETNRTLFLNSKVVISKLKRHGPIGSAYVKVLNSSGDGINVAVVTEDGASQDATVVQLTENTAAELTPTVISAEQDDQQVTVTYYDGEKKELSKLDLKFTVVYISLDSDADRDGVIEENNPNKGSWTGGPDGHGAVLVTKNDDMYLGPKPDNPVISTGSEIIDSNDKEFAKYTHLKIRTKGPVSATNLKLRLYVKEELSQRLLIFNMTDPIPSSQENFYIVGFRQETTTVTVPVGGEVDLLVIGTVFPDDCFDGLIEVFIEYRVGMLPMFSDRVILRTAPWIMTPNTQTPVRFYAAQMTEDKNAPYLARLQAFADDAGVEFQIVSSKMCQSNQWMQDEIEFGYTQTPTVTSTTVLHSPRDRGFTAFIKTMLSKEMGVIQRYNPHQDRTSLDCFGNLECSPPVTVGGVEYPFGRIYHGSTLASCQGLADSTEMGPFRRMMKVVRGFLRGQKVQKPFELFSDWLVVGHVDEFSAFVPANSGKKFKLLLGSPSLFYSMLNELKADGHGAAKILEGKNWLDGSKAEITVDEFLSDAGLQKFNSGIQQIIDYNRDIFKRELGLTEGDIIDIPLPFHGDGRDWASGHACAYIPDMVNLVVLGTCVGVPKPFGPQIGGRCCFETLVEDLLGPLGLQCTFIDDWNNYHIEDGEVHCGSNTLREPFETKWWTTEF